jgi:predicted permease
MKPGFHLTREIAWAVRGLSKRPVITGVQIVSTAFGIAAATVVFSVVHSAALKPLPYKDPHSIVELAVIADPVCAPHCRDLVAGHVVEQWAAEQNLFEQVATLQLTRFTLWESVQRNDRSVMRAPGAVVSPEFFAVLGTSPVIGRFPSIDDVARDRRVVVLGHTLWKSIFGGEPAAIGATLALNGTPHTVIGVMPPRFDYPGVAMWALEVQEPAGLGVQPQFRVIARTHGHAAMPTIASRLNDITVIDEPSQGTMNRSMQAIVSHLHAPSTELVTVFAPLFAGVGVLLIFVLANVASFSVIHSMERTQDTAVRLALGAPRWTILKATIIEHATIIVVSLVLGLLIYVWSARVVSDLIADRYGIDLSLRPEFAVFLFANVLAVAVGVGVGMVPALVSMRTDAAAALRLDLEQSNSKGTTRVWRWLVTAEIAGAVVLAVTASSLARSLIKAYQTDLGYNADQIVWMQADLTDSGNGARSSPFDFVDAITDSLRGGQGLTSVAGWSEVFPRAPQYQFRVQGRDALGLEETPAASFGVSKHFFDIFDLRVVSGRFISSREYDEQAPVGLISKTAAELWWPGENPLGRAYRVDSPARAGRWITVVGVVEDADIKPAALRYALGGTPALPYTYDPLTFDASGLLTSIVVRRNGPIADTIRKLRQSAVQVAPTVYLEGPMSFEDRHLRDGRLMQLRLNADLVITIAVWCIFLACMGVFGTVAQAARRRTRELGIRRALGATDLKLRAFIMADVAQIILIGATIGLLIHAAMADVIEAKFWSIDPTSPTLLIGVPMLLVIVAGTAGFLGAGRGFSSDPADVLRME